MLCGQQLQQQQQQGQGQQQQQQQQQQKRAAAAASTASTASAVLTYASEALFNSRFHACTICVVYNIPYYVDWIW